MPMPSVLFLDDSDARRRRFLEHCPRGSTATTANACLYALSEFTPWDLVFLDHDLEDEINSDPGGSNTGSEVVRWIVANRPKIGRIVVHSLSDENGNMTRDLRAAGYDAECIGFMSLIQRFDEVLNATTRERTAP